MRPVAFVGVLMSGVLIAPCVSAQTAPPTTEDCQGCHAEPSLVRSDGRPVVVPPEAFAASVHAPFSCVDCHSDLAKLTEFPHPERLAPVNCGSCHDEPAAGLAGSVHGKVAAAAGGPLQCASCHGPPHRIRPSADFESPTHKLQIAETCAQCHAGLTGPGVRQGPAVAGMFADSIHGQALTRTTLAPTMP